jgi:transposase-like protein
MELENHVEEKARVVGLYKQSGLTRSEFCRREGVSLFNLRALAGKGGSEQSGALCGA